MIGLSGGAWVRVVSSFPGVEQIDVVEINPGYVELVGRYPELARVLADPRVRIHGDDGRRWLRRHPGQRYDLIVMNTSYHWRAYTSLLLSREFHAMVRQHLQPGGLYAYNSTFSWDAFKTAATVFRHVHGFGNLVIASDHDPRPELARGRERFAALTLDGAPVLDLSHPEVAAKVEAVLRQVEPFQHILEKAGREVEVITDENMITDYRYGQTVLGFFFRPRAPQPAPPRAPATAATPDAKAP
jgi:spermidine synthase